MSTFTRILAVLVILLIAGAGIYWLAPTTPDTGPTTPEPAAVAVNPLQPLAQHHCAKLGDAAAVSACVSRILADMQAGNTAPVVPELQTESCNELTDPLEQHRCHGRIGHDFAISTGDITKCDVIPMEDIRLSCRTTIIVNEVKKLHALETDSAGQATP